MNDLSQIALIFGGILAVFYIMMITSPEKFLSFMKSFPRNKWAGRVLAAVDIAWVAWLLIDMPLGRFEGYRTLLYVLVPVSYFLIVLFMDELLAARALGGLMLLVPVPILKAARGSDSPYRFIIVVLAYIIAVKGIVLVLSPYQIRKMRERFIKDEKACRAWGMFGLVIAITLVALGITVY